MSGLRSGPSVRLHPPILEDLGLAAAIEDLLGTICGSEADWVVTTSIDNLTSGGRPPADIELAAYRVVQEAVANAVQHSGGRRLHVEATVARAADLRTA